MARIPLFYRLILLWFEPISSGFGCYMNLFDKDMYLNSFIPPALATRDPTHNLLFNQLGAGFFVVATTQGVLLRYTNDVNVWKMLNGCLLGWDFILLWSLWDGLSAQGRLDPSVWRADDLSAIVPTIFMTFVRAAVVAGVGLEGAKANTEKLKD
ncbi:hypothetical protein BDV06DRAFT_202199 [Aspergillus oleicola]